MRVSSKLEPMPLFDIINKRFSPTEFSDYVEHVLLNAWTPRMIVLHNTAEPTLAERPNGFNSGSVEDLHHYYEFEAEGSGWSGGPHLFVDQNGIWVFNPLDRKGVHSPSWNRVAWGIEMLGDFAKEAFDTGDGKKVQDNAVAALAVLFRKLGIKTISDDVFKLHKEDPLTTHACPGANVHKDVVRVRVQAILDGPKPAPSNGLPIKIIIYRQGGGQNPSAVVNGNLRNGTTFVDRAAIAAGTGISAGGTGEVALRDFVGVKFSITFDAKNNKIYLGEQ